MSKPLNPLDKYRTYSYHHILLISNSTEGIRAFSSPQNNPDETLVNITNTQVGEAINGTNFPNTYLLIDTRRTSSFSIRDVTYTTLPGSGLPSNSHVFSGSLEMTIVDPDGIVFINYLKNLIDNKLKASFTGLVFLLKTMFIGHTYEDTTEHIQTSSIPLLLTDIEFDVTYKEGVYQIKFTPINQGVVTGVYQYSKIKDVRSILTDKSMTLGSAIRNFEDRLNQSYRDHYAKYNTSFQLAGGEIEEPKRVGKLLQVMITLPRKNPQIPDSADWENFLLATDNDKNFETQFKKVLSEQEKSFKSKLKADEEANAEAAKKGQTVPAKKQISFSPNFTIQDVLNLMFKSCPEVMKMADNTARKNGLIKGFKTLTSITSNDETVLLHYDIVEHFIPDNNPNRQTEKLDESKFTYVTDGKIIPYNSFEYDYIFTGKNTDILDFSIKMQQAQLLLLNNQKLGIRTRDSVLNQKGQEKNPTTPEKQDVSFYFENDVIFFPDESVEQKTNFASIRPNNNREEQAENQKVKSEWLKNISTLHMQSTLSSKMTIRGNPDLMNKYNIDDIPKHAVNDAVKIETALQNRESFISGQFINEYLKSGKEEHRKWLDNYLYDNTNAVKISQGTDEKSAGFKAAMLPVFIKINIFAPNIGSIGEKLFNTPERFIQFWYTGWYRIMGICHKFSDNGFTQELSIASFDSFGPSNTQNEAVPPKTENK